MKIKNVMKYGHSEDIKGFDFRERIKCWLRIVLFNDEHYFMTPDEDTPAWCGRCGKIERTIKKL